MALHIKNIEEAIEIIKETDKVLDKLRVTIPTSSLHRLKMRVTKFLDNLEE